MARKLIHVTQDDIDTATRDLSMREEGWVADRSRTCPIAKAVRREFAADEVCVIPDLAWVYYGEHSDAYNISERAHQFLVRFDQFKPVEPFNFYLKD